MFSCVLFSFLLSVAASVPISGEETNISYEIKYLEQKLDHFNFINKDTFKNKYLISDKYWKRGEGPIFVYTGNEDKIEVFCKNTGFMWDIAPEFGALLIFIEHRYYGESLPNLNKSSVDYYSYLSTVQVLEDFAVILEETRRTIEGGENLPIIAFGGSYGGMLATWMRIKYPHIIEGVLASSASMLLYQHINKCNSYYKLTTQIYKRESPEYPRNIRRSWDAMKSFNTTGDQMVVVIMIEVGCVRASDETGLPMLRAFNEVDKISAESGGTDCVVSGGNSSTAVKSTNSLSSAA